VSKDNARGDESLAERLLGAWELVSFELRGADGAIQPFGPDPIGVLYYDGGGRVFVHLAPRDRARAASDDNFGGMTAQEALEAMTSYVGYTSRWELDEDGGFVIHHIELSAFENLVGWKQKRFVELSGDELTLTTMPRILHGAERSVAIVWRRAG